MKKLIIFTSLFILFFVFMLPGILALGIRIIPGNDQAPYDVNIKRSIYGQFQITQEFIAQQNNLSAIGISLGNPNLKNKSEVDLVLKDSGRNVVRKSNINGASIADGALVRFSFDPITNSKNKSYTFELSNGSAGPEEVINVYYATSNESWIGPSTFGEEINKNGLPIVVYYSASSRFGVVQEIYSSWFSRLLHPSFQRSS